MSKTSHIQGNKGISIRNKLRNIDFNQVLVIAIDPGKFFPKALTCNYYGEIIQKPFFFHIDKKGFNILTSNIETAAEKINAQKILVGVEATGHYHQKIVQYLNDNDYDVLIINASTTSDIRSENLNWSKTDDIDLYAIATAITENKITESYLPQGVYQKLLRLTRNRRHEVNNRSRIKIKIRTFMDHIWPNFQGESKLSNQNNNSKSVNNIFSDFWSKSSVCIMENYPHPTQILKLGAEGLKNLSKEHELKMRQSTINKLLAFAKNAYTQPVEVLNTEITLLKKKIEDLKHTNDKITYLNEKIEELFVKTPGILLLSLPGISVVIGSEFTAELGPVENYDYAKQIIKRAGTNPVVKESGGKKPIYGSISKQGNPKFRRVIYLAGKTLKRHNPYFKIFAERLNSKGKSGKQVSIACGNKFIKVAFAMLKRKEFFHPPKWDGEPLTKNVYKKLSDDDNITEARKTLIKELELNPEKFVS